MWITESGSFVLSTTTTSTTTKARSIYHFVVGDTTTTSTSTSTTTTSCNNDRNNDNVSYIDDCCPTGTGVEFVNYGSMEENGLRHRSYGHFMEDHEGDSNNNSNNNIIRGGVGRNTLGVGSTPSVVVGDVSTIARNNDQGNPVHNDDDDDDPLLIQPPSTIVDHPTHHRKNTVTNLHEVYQLIRDKTTSLMNSSSLGVDLVDERNNPDDDGAQQQQQQQHTHHCTSTDKWHVDVVAGCVANLCSATLGAGVLALPYAMQQAGLIVGTILLLLSAGATIASIEILIQAINYYHCTTYETLAQHVIGSWCRSMVECAVLIFCGGCAVAYIIAVGDILEQSHILIANSRSVSMILAWTLAMLPLSLLRTMNSLQFASSVGIAAIGTLVFASLVHYISNTNPDESSNTNTPVQLRDFWWPVDGLRSVMMAGPIVFFAFSCQTNVCAIYNEMIVPSPNDTNVNHNQIHSLTKSILMRRVTLTAVTICALLYFSVSIIALADFGKDVLPNMLSNYHHDAGQIMKVATAAMAFAVVMAFPLNIFPARVTLIGLIQHHKINNNFGLPSCTTAGSDDDDLTAALLEDDNNHEIGALVNEGVEHVYDTNNQSPEIHLHHIIPLQLQQDEDTNPNLTTGATEVDDSNDDITQNFNLQQHVATTLFLTGMALGLALVLPNISVVFGLLGGTASSIIGFCVPGLLGIQLCKDLKAETQEQSMGTLLVSWMLLAGGVVVGIATTGITAYNIVYAHS